MRPTASLIASTWIISSPFPGANETLTTLKQNVGFLQMRKRAHLEGRNAGAVNGSKIGFNYPIREHHKVHFFQVYQNDTKQPLCTHVTLEITMLNGGILNVQEYVF
jgi:hypothetical protein